LWIKGAGREHFPYLRDPDGNEVELYVDTGEPVWKNNLAAVLAPIKPLHV
jgi:catechol-2,3-dioxygenase